MSSSGHLQKNLFKTFLRANQEFLGGFLTFYQELQEAVFNAAQPGVGRVQVLGSKSLEAADYLAIKYLEVDRRVPAWRVF